MKIEKSEIKQFEPITITLESELEAKFIDDIFNASNSELSGITNMNCSEIKIVLNRTDGYTDTSHQKLRTLWSI